MAAILQFENEDESDTLSLIDATGIDMIVASNAYSVSEKETHLTRSFRFLVKGLTVAAVRATVSELIAFLRQSTDWKDDDLDPESIWLREAPDGTATGDETRQLVTGWGLKIGSTEFHDPLQIVNTSVVCTLAITTKTGLEYDTGEVQNIQADTTDNPTQNLVGESRIILPWFGGGTDNGSLDMRLSRFRFTAETNIRRLWIGIKKVRAGSTSGIKPVLQLKDGTASTSNGADFIAETGSYATTVLRCRFDDFGGVNSMSQRWQGYPAGIMGLTNDSAQRAIGEYVAIMRYKVLTAAAGNTFAARLGVSFESYSITGAAYNNIKFLNSAVDPVSSVCEWHMINMGRVKFPPKGYRSLVETVADPMRTVALTLDLASLDTGAGVYVDTITLVPYDHYIALEGTDLDLVTGGNAVEVVTHEDGTVEAIQTDGSVLVTGYPRISASHNWSMPKEPLTTKLVIVGERDLESDTADGCSTPTAYVHRRWEYFHD